jgi:hypothetical protein
MSGRLFTLALAATVALLLSSTGAAIASPEEIVAKITEIANEEGKKEEEKIEAAAKYIKTQKEGLKEAVELLKTQYDEAKTFFEEEKMAKVAAILTVFAMGAHKAGNIGVFGEIRVIFWNQIYDLASNDMLPDEEKLKNSVALVKMWKPMVDDIFREVKRQHNKHEAEGSKEEMRQDMAQLKLLAKAVFEAFGRKDLQESLDSFIKAMQDFAKFSPEDRKKIKRAEDLLKSAMHKYEGKEYVPARDVFLLAYKIFKELKAKRKIMITAYWLAVAHEKTKEYWEIKGYLDEAQKLAEELGDSGKVDEIKEYWKSLKAREKAGEFNLTKSPLADPANFGPSEPVVKLKTVYGKRLQSPSPTRFKDILFWKPLYICDGEYQGKPGDKIKLPMPGLHYWIKRKTNIFYANNLEGRGGRKLRIGSKPGKQSILGSYFFKNKALNIKFEFLACILRTVKVCERTITYPSDDTSAYNFRLFSNTARKGSFKGKEFYIGDDNCNGLFKDFGTEENPNNQIILDLLYGGADSISVGRGGSEYQTFLGTLIRIGSTFYEMSLNSPVTEAQFKEYKGPMGKVQLKFQGNPKAHIKHFILSQKVGAEKIFFVNIGGSRGPVEVPVGAYFFKYGLLTTASDPEKGYRMEIYRGKYPGIKVEEGKTVVVEFGGPYTINYPITFDPNTGDGEVKTYEMTVTGAKGEVYRRHWPKVFAPAYQIRDSRGKLAAKGKMRCFSETDALEPIGKGAELLYAHPIHFFFKGKAGSHQPPFKVYINVNDVLLGKIRDPEFR